MTDAQQTPDELAMLAPANPVPNPATPVPDTTTGTGEQVIEQRVQVPTLSRDVWYSDKQIPGSIRAAKVTGTRDSIAEAEGMPIPESSMHVHLIVFPPQGTPYPVRDVAYDANGAANTWRWPVRSEG